MARKGLSDRVVLRQALAEELDPQRLFGLGQPFDVIFFSYALTMIPTWEQALERALACTVPTGRLYIVDFCDQMGLPTPVRWANTRWLGLFGVHHKPGLVPELERLSSQGRCAVKVTYLHGRYAFRAEVALCS
jgi:S-adenosylmethionine-diacylgycerolhomoserine-N-methlytransferase